MVKKTIKNAVKNCYEAIFSRLANKLALFFSVLISLLIIISTSLTYNNFSKTLQNDFITRTKSELKLNNIMFDDYFGIIRDLSLSFRKDEQMMDLLTFDSDDLTRQRYVQARLNEMYYSRKDIEQISFYIPLKNELYLVNRQKTAGDIKTDKSYIENDWYKTVITQKDYGYTAPGFPDSNKEALFASNNQIFTFHRAIIDIETKGIIGVISLSMNISKAKNILYDEGISDGGALTLLDRSNVPYFSTAPSFYSNFMNESVMAEINANGLDHSSVIMEKAGEEYLVIFDISEIYGWKMLKIIPLSIINKMASRTRNANILLGVIFWMISIPLILLLSQAITSSLNRLTKKMEQLGEGNFEVHLTLKGSDEIASLSRKFNDMASKINELVNEEYKAKVAEKSARLRALEAQINPHFLYNTMQAISTKALQKGMYDVSDMIEALGSNLRYAIKGKEMLKVADELKYVQNYVLLQKSRFGDRLSVDFNIQEDALDKIIPKLIIQTLVENSIVHGLEKTIRKVDILVNVYLKENFLWILVSDNGPGIDPQTLANMHEAFNESSFAEDYNESIGLKNLNARLKLIYEGKASLEIKSRNTDGTEVAIIIPV